MISAITKCKARQSNKDWPDGHVCDKEVVSEEMNEQRSGGSERVSFMNILGKNSRQKERPIFRRASSFPEVGAGPSTRHMIRTDPRGPQALCSDSPVCSGLCSLLVDKG